MRCAYLLKACCRRPSGLHSREVSSKGDVEEGSGFEDLSWGKNQVKSDVLVWFSTMFSLFFSNRWSHHHWTVQNISLPDLYWSLRCLLMFCRSGPSFQNTKQVIPLWRWSVKIVKQSHSQHFFQRIVAWEVTCNPKDYVSLGSNLELLSTNIYIYIPTSHIWAPNCYYTARIQNNWRWANNWKIAKFECLVPSLWSQMVGIPAQIYRGLIDQHNSS